MSEVTKVVSAENAPINNSMNYAKKYEASYEADAPTPSGGGGVLVVTATESDSTYACDKTAAEMLAACQTGLVVIQTADGNPGGFYARPVVEFYSDSGYYGFMTDQGDEYESDSADACPTWTPSN